MNDDLSPDDSGNARKWKPDDPRRLRMVEKRAEILRAAQPVLLRDGLGGSTLDRVASEGGISKMTLYRHFPSKEALFEGLVVAMCSQMREVIEGAPSTDVTRPWKDRLTHELRDFVATLVTPDALALYRLIVAEGWRLPNVARAFDRSGMSVIRGRIAVLLETGGVSKRKSRQLAGDVAGITLGDAYQRAVVGIAESDDDKAFARQIVAAVSYASTCAAEANPGATRA